MRQGRTICRLVRHNDFARTIRFGSDNKQQEAKVRKIMWRPAVAA